MTRKKVSDDVIDAANIPDGEEIVVTETRRVGRQKKAKPPEPEPIEPEDDADEFELVGENVFAEGTIAAELFGRLTGDEEEREEKELAESLQIGNVLVVRYQDSATDRFVNPCGGRVSYAPLRNLDFTSITRTDIEEQVRETHGGGHYYLQIQIGNQMHTGWKVSLADPPNYAAKLAAANAPTPEPPAAIQPAPPPANPIDSMLESMSKMKQLKEFLFGDTEAAMQKQIDRLEGELREARDNRPPAEAKSESMMILEKALSINNPDLTERLLEHAFPADGGGSHWIADAIKTVIDNREAIGQFLGPMLGGPAMLPPAGVAGILAKQPPAGAVAPPAPRSNFRRAQPPADVQTATPMSEIDRQPPPIINGDLETPPMTKAEAIASDNGTKADAVSGDGRSAEPREVTETQREKGGEMSTDTITWQDALALISPKGRAEVVAIVKRACDERGGGWIDSIAIEYPSLVWIADLVANNNAVECIAKLEKEFGISLGLVRGPVAELHAAIRAEIDKPRG